MPYGTHNDILEPFRNLLCRMRSDATSQIFIFARDKNEIMISECSWQKTD